MEQSHGTTFSRAGLAQAAHPDVSRLPLGARAVYVALCGLLAVGQPRRVSQELIAEVACISEGTVSAAMPVLVACGLVVRSIAPDGRGYELTLLPLPAPPDPDERLAEALERLRAKREAGGDPDPDDDGSGPDGGGSGPDTGPDGGAGDSRPPAGPPGAAARPRGGSRGDPAPARPAGDRGYAPGRGGLHGSRTRQPTPARGGSGGDPAPAAPAHSGGQRLILGGSERIPTPSRPARWARGSGDDPTRTTAARRSGPAPDAPVRERVRVRLTAMALAGGSGDDPIGGMDDHDPESYEQQQQHARVRESVDRDGVPVVSEAAWERMVLGTPGYTSAHFAADYRALLARGKAGAQAVGLIVWARSRGEAIWSADDLETRAQRYHARTCPDAEAAPPPPARPPRSRRGHQRPEILRGKPFDPDAHAERLARLARLLPPDATEDDELDLCIAFDAGLDDAAAVARMEEGRRGRRA